MDPALQATDSVAPSPFTEATAFAYRGLGTVCKGNICTSFTCGDSGAIELTFVPPTDDQTPEAELGYRIELIEGVLPQPMLDDISQARPLTPTLVFNVGFDDVTRLDAVIALVAVDRAGNESAPSAPIELRDSGCVKAGEDECLSDADAASNGAGCSVAGSAPGQAASWPGVALAIAAYSLLRAPRAWRRRSAHL